MFANNAFFICTLFSSQFNNFSSHVNNDLFFVSML